MNFMKKSIPTFLVGQNFFKKVESITTVVVNKFIELFHLKNVYQCKKDTRNKQKLNVCRISDPGGLCKTKEMF